MNLEQIETIFMAKQGATKDFPFGDDTMVFKVMDKMFGLISLKKNPLNINLKCDPNDAIAYRDIYECVNPGYHMNKKHWNTITLDGTIKEEILKDMVNESYDLIVSKLTKKQKEELFFK
ncbi:MmcQ/YjbR family DNA-binding protein [Candidatus Marinarcus aquaticus]|uniref:MmcQ-like protein n=1 Tax=Candidatus Marinarcus aquaticus TaxID=2044504 RepID=A0A4V1LNM1_9BACT|nr:MmcQ/YjbR family DNA-binding protein [Candidatus Marinarcus aquaticus]RXJ54139.1 MmcQ-like protein [Candidatus Marinarcus aquaticus]